MSEATRDMDETAIGDFAPFGEFDPARFADDDAPPSPPRRSAEKRQKR